MEDNGPKKISPKKISVEKLVSLFLKLKPRRPEPEATDYSRWNQTEEAYREEQEEWLEEVARKKNDE